MALICLTIIPFTYLWRTTFREIGENIGRQEIEYDTNDIIIDEQHYKFNTFNLKFLYSPIERFAIGIGGSYDADREYELRFARNRRALANKHIDRAREASWTPTSFSSMSFMRAKIHGINKSLSNSTLLISRQSPEQFIAADTMCLFNIATPTNMNPGRCTDHFLAIISEKGVLSAR